MCQELRYETPCIPADRYVPMVNRNLLSLSSAKINPRKAGRQAVGDIRRGRQSLGLDRCRSCDRKTLGPIVTIKIYSASGRFVPETRLLKQRARISVQFLGAIRILIFNTFNYTSRI